jgi:hypothetical protein
LCDRDKMKPSERAGDGFVMVILVTMAAFFVSNQVQGTGFYTAAFGPLEMVLFYAPIPLGLAISVARLATGRRNLARPFEIVNALVWVVAGFWLYLVFPFDFAHFASVLPDSLKFLLSWIPNWLARDALLLAGISGAGNSVYIPVLYMRVRRELVRRATPSP